MKRILAVDYGRRRVGLAVSDPLGITAQGLETVEVRSLKSAAAVVAQVAGTQDAGEIVVGLPLNMDGSAGEMAAEAGAFAEEVERRTGLPVRRWDERLTSVAAVRTMREMGVRTKGRKGDVDRMSAVLILQGYLDSKNVRES